MTDRCRLCGCELEPWEIDFCEGCAPLFLPATKGEPMKCEHCKVCITQAEADEAWNIREAAGASVELTLCPDCGQMEADAMEVEEFRAAFGRLDND